MWGWYVACRVDSFVNCSFGENGWCLNPVHARSLPQVGMAPLVTDEDEEDALRPLPRRARA